MTEFQEFSNVFFLIHLVLATNLQNFCSFRGSSQNLQEQGKPLPADSWTRFFISIFYFDLDTYLGMVQLLVAGWISLQLFDPPQMNLVACGRQMPMWRCCRWVHQAKWVPGGRFLQKSRVFQPAPLPSRSILQKVKTVLMSLSSNRNTNWSLREHKMLWEPIDIAKAFTSELSIFQWLMANYMYLQLEFWFLQPPPNLYQKLFPFTICYVQTLLLTMISWMLDNLNHFIGGSIDHNYTCLCIKIIILINKMWVNGKFDYHTFAATGSVESSRQ